MHLREVCEGPNFDVSQSTTPAGFAAGYGRWREFSISGCKNSLVDGKMKKLPYYNAELGDWLGQRNILLDGRAFLSQGSVFGHHSQTHGASGLRASVVGLAAPTQTSE